MSDVIKTYKRLDSITVKQKPNSVLDSQIKIWDGAAWANKATVVNMAANTIKGNNTGSSAAPVDLTTSQVRTLLSINNVDNTSDASKPVSTATQTALDGKQPLATVLTNTTASFTTTLETKLSGIATGATANQTDSYLLSRTNHTGTQTASTISNLASTVKAYRLDEFAAPNTAVSFNSQKITGVATPTANGEVATYDFVLNQIQASSSGISVKDPVRVVSETNVTLSGLQTIDGVSLSNGNRVLLVGQTDAKQNGVYLASSGSWSRATTEDENVELKGAFWLVNEGTNQKTQWIVNNATMPVVGTDNITIVKFGAASIYTASNGVTLVGADFRAVAKSSGGITVASDGIAVDTAIVARKYSATIGGSTSMTVTHNLGTKDVHVTIREVSTGNLLLDNQFGKMTFYCRCL